MVTENYEAINAPRMAYYISRYMTNQRKIIKKYRKFDLFGVNVDDCSTQEAVEAILNLAKAGSRENYVVTVNSEFVMKARRDTKFANILNKATIALADGWWVVFLKLKLGGKAHDRVSGVDLVEKLCSKAADLPITVGFLGAFSGVAREVAKRQKISSPGLKVAVAESGDSTIGSDLRLKEQFSRYGRVDILFVAYGMGKQEYFIEKARHLVDVGVMIGVGGAFDYIAGVKKRAPKWMQDRGVEWLWRLAQDPVRVWRMRVLPVFFLMIWWKILKTKIFGKKFAKLTI